MIQTKPPCLEFAVTIVPASITSLDLGGAWIILKSISKIVVTERGSINECNASGSLVVRIEGIIFGVIWGDGTRLWSGGIPLKYRCIEIH